MVAPQIGSRIVGAAVHLEVGASGAQLVLGPIGRAQHDLVPVVLCEPVILHDRLRVGRVGRWGYLVIEVVPGVADEDDVAAEEAPAACVAQLRRVHHVGAVGEGAARLLAAGDVPQLTVVDGAQGEGEVAAGDGRQRRQRDRELDVAVLEVDVLDVGDRVSARGVGAAVGPGGGLLRRGGRRRERRGDEECHEGGGARRRLCSDRESEHGLWLPRYCAGP